MKTLFLTLFAALIGGVGSYFYCQKYNTNLQTMKICPKVPMKADLFWPSGVPIHRVSSGFSGSALNLVSKNGLFAMTFKYGSGLWHIVSRYRASDSPENNGSIWNPLAGLDTTIQNHVLTFSSDASLKVTGKYKGKDTTLWSICPKLYGECDQFYLELTDYGNLQIVSNCGQILWESRSDTNPPELVGSENGYYTGNRCIHDITTSKQYTSITNINGAPISKTCIATKNPFIGFDISDLYCYKPKCLFPVPVLDFCQRISSVQGCPGCLGNAECVNIFDFEIGQDYQVILYKNKEEIKPTTSTNGIISFQIPNKDIKQYEFNFKYPKESKNQKIKVTMSAK